MKKNKKIYIILSYTGTILSKIIKLYTRKKYSHTSISLDENLENMYGFGRTNAYNPFNGGFVHESPKWGTFKRFYKTKAVILSLEVSEEQYQGVVDTLEKFKAEEKKYKYNYLGVVFAAFNKPHHKKYRYYCSEFVQHVLEQAKIKTNLPSLSRPMDFLNIENIEIVYEGVLKEYPRYK